jgi:hypothetical protein
MSDKRFKLLSHSLWECQDDLVFCPKYRSRVLGGEVGSDVDRHSTSCFSRKKASACWNVGSNLTTCTWWRRFRPNTA